MKRRVVGRALLVALLALAVALPAGAVDLPTAPAHDPDEVRRLADEILDRDEFRQPEPGLIDRARTEVEDLIGSILTAAFSGGVGSLIGWLVLAAAVGAIVWFGTRFGRTVQADRRVGIHIEGVHRRTSSEWRAEAAEHDAEGAWKLALRCRYRALVGDLIAEGVLDDVAGRTTGEYRRDLAERSPERSAGFGAATELFELAWYADRPTGPEESARFRALVDEVSGVRA